MYANVFYNVTFCVSDIYPCLFGFICSSYSVMWPIKNSQKGDECTRDFLSGIGEDKHRSARLTAWFQTPENYFIHVLPRCPL